MPSEYANDLMARVGLDTTNWKKGITELNAGIKHIETGFQASAAMMDDWSNNSEGLRKRIDTLNDKLAIQKQKLDILKKAYDEEVAANGESSKAAEELAKKMYATKNEIERTKSSIDNYTDKLVEMGDIAGKVGKKLDTFANKTKTLSAVSAAALTAIGAGLVKAGQNADELNTLAKQTGLTVEEIQKFKYASDLIDVGLEDMTGALCKMTRNMISTSSEVKTAWEQLGVSTVDANGKARDAVTVFYEVLEALSNVRNETERDQLAMLLFGKSANDLAGIVDDGGAALRTLGDEAESLGLIMSQDAVDGANEFNDAIDSMKAKVTASLGKAFSENADELSEAMQSIADVIVSVVNAFANMPSGCQKTVVGILAVGAAASPLLSTGSKIASLISKIQKYRLAQSLKATGTAARGAATGVNTFSTAMNGAIPVIGLVIIALAKLASAYEETKQKIIDSIEAEYDAKVENATEAYNAETKLLNEQMDEAYELYSADVKKHQDAYDEKVKAAQEYVKSTKKLLQEEQKAKAKAHKEALEMIEEERAARKKAVDDAVTGANRELQNQIDAIDAEIEAEERAKQEVEDAQKLKDLQTAVDAARTMADKRNAERELAEFIAEQEAEKTAAAREELKKQLQNQIEINDKKAEAQKDLIDEELDTQKAALEESYSQYEESLNKRFEALETHVDRETQKAQIALDTAIKNADDKYKQDTANFKAQLEAKRLDYEKYLQDMETLKNNDTANASPSAGQVWEEFKESNYWLSGQAGENHNKNMLQFYEKQVKSYRDFGEEPPEYILKEYERLKASIGSNATGTDFWRGGLTRINEEGGEILNLPRGTQIIPHDVSMEMARSAGRQASVTNNTTTNTTHNAYNYGAQQQVTVLEVNGQRISTVILPTISVGMASSTRSRGRALGIASKRV